MKPTPRTQADILTDIKRTQAKRAKLWPSYDRCSDPGMDMLLCRQLDDLKHELKSLSSIKLPTPITDAATWGGHCGDLDWGPVVCAHVSAGLERERDEARIIAEVLRDSYEPQDKFPWEN